MVTAETTKRLYKSRTDRMIDGVCGGVAEYFDLDPTLVRIAWVLLSLLGGSGILLYIAAMILVPANPVAKPPVGGTVKHSSMHNQRFWGILLLGVGIFWLMGNLGVPLWHHWWGFSWGVMLPVILILAGVAFLYGGRNYLTNSTSADEPGGTEATGGPTTDAPHAARTGRLYRSRTEKKMFGVCGGLGNYFNIDPTLVRVLFVVSALASFGMTLFLYVLMAIVVPKEPLLQHVS